MDVQKRDTKIKLLGGGGGNTPFKMPPPLSAIFTQLNASMHRAAQCMPHSRSSNSANIDNVNLYNDQGYRILMSHKWRIGMHFAFHK